MWEAFCFCFFLCFYEFLFGSFFEKKIDQAAKIHYELAFVSFFFLILKIYTACNIFALKMNWFSMLTDARKFEILLVESLF